MECPKCGEKVKESSKFCEECGAKIKKEHKSKNSVVTVVIILIILAALGGAAYYGYLQWEKQKWQTHLAQVQAKEAEQAAEQARQEALAAAERARQEAVRAQEDAAKSSFRQDCIRNCDIEGQNWFNGCVYESSDYSSRTCTCKCKDFWGSTKTIVV